MNNKLIIVKQLPVIEERLAVAKKEVSEKVEQALSLVCNEDTVKEIKKVRSSLNKEFKEYEEQRKEIKNAVIEPYNKFQDAYKENISDIYKKGETLLKERINSVENELKSDKEKEVVDYFEEFKLANNDFELGFVTFEKTGINVTLSASLKSLKIKAKEFVERVCCELETIQTQENSTEILVEYYKCIDLNQSIKIVKERTLAKKELEKREVVKEEIQEPVKEVVEELSKPQKIENDPVKELSFKVKAPISKLKLLKKFLEDGGYKYE